MRRLGFLLMCPVLLASCSDTGESAHLARKGPAVGRWAGTQWQFETIDGKPPLAGRADMAFDNANLILRVGCSHLQGPWRVEDTRLVAGPFDQSEAVCPEASWEQGQAVTALLAAMPHMEENKGRLVLQSSGHTAELVRVAE